MNLYSIKCCIAISHIIRIVKSDMKIDSKLSKLWKTKK